MSRDREDSGAKQRGKFSERPRNSPLTERSDRAEDTALPSGSISQQRRYASLRQTSDERVNCENETAATAVSSSEQRQEETESTVSQTPDYGQQAEQPFYSAETRQTENVSREPQIGGTHTAMQNSSRYRQKFRQEPRSAESGTGASKLRFADDELPGQDAVNRKLEKAQERAVRFEQRLHKAENKLPSRRKPRLETSADPATGKPKTRLRFEKEVKEKSETLKGSAALRPVKGAANLAAGMVHKQIYKNEHENVGVQAAHRAEIAGETGLRCASRAHKLAPYNKVMLTEAGILQNGSRFTDIYAFEHEGLTNLLFPFENAKLDVGKLAMWRLQTFGEFSGKWLTDYVDNRLGGFIDESRFATDKPDCPLLGADGNVFNLIGLASRTLKKHGLGDQAKEMSSRVFACGSYGEALNIIGEYVNITDAEHVREFRPSVVKKIKETKVAEPSDKPKQHKPQEKGR